MGYSLVDTLKDVKDNVVGELRIGVFEFCETSLKHAQRFNLAGVHVVVDLLGR